MDQRHPDENAVQLKTTSGGSSVSSSLLVRVKRDEPDGWQRLIELIGPTIYQWCRQMGLQPVDAGDVAQEVFRALVSGIAEFRRDRPGDSFRGWVWRITQYKVSDHFRAQQKQPLALGGSSAQSHWENIPDPLCFEDSAASASAWNAILERALDSVRGKFGAKVWRACWLIVIEGRSADDVAQELGMTRGAVYVAKSRVLRSLREELEGLYDLDLERESPTTFRGEPRP